MSGGTLQSPYATVPMGAELYGQIQGTQPDWSKSTFVDRGRRHVSPGTGSQLATVGLQGWFSSDTGSMERPMVRHQEQAPSSSYAEPTVQGAHRTYYGRRAVTGDDGMAYRRSLRYVPPPALQDKPEGKKYIPEPYGPPPRVQGRGSVPEYAAQHREAATAPEPSMPRLSRPYGCTILRECDQELSYERAFGQKIRVGQDTYRGTGRAGDLSHGSFAPPRRPEDDAEFFKTLKDSPTFIRFCNSLPPKPAVSPHERRNASLQRQHATELQRERELVAALSLPDPEEA